MEKLTSERKVAKWWWTIHSLQFWRASCSSISFALRGNFFIVVLLIEFINFYLNELIKIIIENLFPIILFYLMLLRFLLQLSHKSLEMDYGKSASGFLLLISSFTNYRFDFRFKYQSLFYLKQFTVEGKTKKTLKTHSLSIYTKKISDKFYQVLF